MIKAAIIFLFILLTSNVAFAEPASKELDYKTYYQNSLQLHEIQQEKTIDIGTLLSASKQKGTVLLDVRNKEEYECAHIEGAINLSVTDITKESLQSVIPTQDTKIIIYCNNSLEHRPLRIVALTTQAFPLIYQLGYENIYYLQSGYKSEIEEIAALPLIFSSEEKNQNCCGLCNSLRDLKNPE